MSPTPLHTRLISLRLSWADAESFLAEGRLMDVRKRAIVPLAGSIQGPGIIHDMAVRVWLGAADLKIRRVEPVMSAYPFAPSAQTRGESCPDRVAEVQRLLGLRLPDGYGDAVMERVGGPRGCFHVLTLLRLLGPSIVWATRAERPLRPVPGALVFVRSILVDGFRHEGMQIDLHGGLADVHYVPEMASLPAREQLQSGFEANIAMQVRLPAMEAHGAAGRSRRCGPGVGNAETWRTIDSLAGLHGIPLRKGFSARVQDLLGDAEGVEPVTHLIFMSAPVVMQCIPSLFDELDLGTPRAKGPHAATDSCHMWRAGGPLQSM
jgi:hypothetical protein